MSHVAGSPREFVHEHADLPVKGKSLLAEAYRSRETLLRNNLEEADSYNQADYGDFPSVAAVPMGKHGVLAVGSLEPPAVSFFDRRLIEVLGAYGAAVLDRLNNEQALRDERDLLGLLLEISPDAVVRLDRYGTFFQASGHVKEVVEAEEEEILSRTYNDPEWNIIDPHGGEMPDEKLPFSRIVRTGPLRPGHSDLD